MSFLAIILLLITSTAILFGYTYVKYRIERYQTGCTYMQSFCDHKWSENTIDIQLPELIDVPRQIEISALRIQTRINNTVKRTCSKCELEIAYNKNIKASMSWGYFASEIRSIIQLYTFHNDIVVPVSNILKEDSTNARINGTDTIGDSTK